MAVPATISEFLRRKGIPFDEVSHAESLSSIEEAKAMGLAADDVVKVIVAHSSRGPALFALPASARLDMKAVHHVLGDNHARLATEEEMAADLPGYALGAAPPLAELTGMRLYVDDSLPAHDAVVFAAGTHTDSVRIRMADLLAAGPHTIAGLHRVAGKDDQGR